MADILSGGVVNAPVIDRGTLELAEGASIRTGPIAESDAGATLTIAEDLSYAGALTQGAGSKVSIAGGDTLTLSGTNSLSGSVSGAGKLALGDGKTTFSTGATLTTSAWSLTGSGTTATLGEALTYAGTFSAGAGTHLAPNGGALTLKGATTLAGVTVSSMSSHALNLYGATSVSGLTIGGDAIVGNYATANQSGGSITIGDAVSTDKAELINEAARTWDIADNSGIARGADTASLIDNAGLLEKTGGTGTSTVAPTIINTGKIIAASGRLDLKAAVSGAGTDVISGASKLEFDASVAAAQAVDFTGSGGELLLDAPLSFHGQVSGFGASDAIALLGAWSVGLFTENATDTGGTLALSSGSTHMALDFLGSYQNGKFTPTEAGGTTLIKFTA